MQIQFAAHKILSSSFLFFHNPSKIPVKGSTLLDWKKKISEF